MKNTHLKIVSIHGVPRSGTTWLGHIFNSHPNVAFRYQPLFAYRFRDRIDLNSSRKEVYSFLDDLYHCLDDAFILNKPEMASKIHPKFKKVENPSFLVMKMVRFHYMIKKFLDTIDDVKVIGIVRNPLAVINSWLSSPREFKEAWDPMEEWRFAAQKNAGKPEEFNGFEKWKEIAVMFLWLEEKFPENFYLIRYEDLVENAIDEVKKVFTFVGLDLSQSVRVFVEKSQTIHHDDPYAVYKNPMVKDRWKNELDNRIADAIVNDLAGTELERFLQ